MRPHLVYDDVIYDEAYNTTFHQKLESNQYNAWLALLRAIRGLPREKRYQELGLESLQRQCWCSCLFYKIFKENKPVCLSNLIPTKKANYNTTNADKITLFPTKYNYFKNYFLKIYIFFPSTVIEWKKLDRNLPSAASFSVSEKKLLKLVRPSPNNVFNCHNCKEIK